MALVPYVEYPLPALSKLQNSSAHFRFADREVHLAQDWRKLGVAAVVWDAVSVPLPLLFVCHQSSFSLDQRVLPYFPGSRLVHVSGAGQGGPEGEAGN